LNGVRRKTEQTRRSIRAWILRRHREYLLIRILSCAKKDRTVDGEQRWHAIGAVRKAVLLVVHVYIEESPDGEETVRIISAREADPRERRIYLEQAAD
jgi:uncharacterized DUF497 family protein